MPNNKVRGRVTLAEDTEAPKTVSVMDLGLKFHFQISVLSGNIYRTESLPIFKKKNQTPTNNKATAYANGVKCRINFNIILNITPPTVRKYTFKYSFACLLSYYSKACK